MEKPTRPDESDMIDPDCQCKSCKEYRLLSEAVRVVMAMLDVVESRIEKLEERS